LDKNSETLDSFVGSWNALQDLIVKEEYPLEIRLSLATWRKVCCFVAKWDTDEQGVYFWLHSTKIRPPKHTNRIIDLSDQEF
jgi:hypothetical protein